MREKFNHVAFRGVAACVPGQQVTMDDLYALCPSAEVQNKLKRAAVLSGLDTRYVTRPESTAADLAKRAASALLEKLDWDPESIDILIMVTQTPDELCPPVGYRLHRWLGLSRRCAVFDHTNGCAGATHALCFASGILDRGSAKRALILTGDTVAKCLASDDVFNRSLLGEAGAAMALERNEDYGIMSAILGADSSGVDVIVVPGSGYRPAAQPSYYQMDGMQVAAFSHGVTPTLLRELAEYSGCSLASIDKFYLHQANAHLDHMIMRGAKLRQEQMPMVIAKYGNCGSSSIQQTICEYRDDIPLDRPFSVCLCGFGTGFAWSAIHMVWRGITTVPVIHAKDL